MKRKIITGHTLIEYKSKYGYLFKRNKLKKYAKNKDEKFLKNKKYWEIDNYYYEVPLLSKNVLISLISTLATAAVATSIVLPIVLCNRNSNRNYGGNHFVDIKDEEINKQVVIDETSTAYSLTLLNDIKSNQTISSTVKDITCSNENYTLNVKDFKYENKVVTFNASIDPKSNLTTNEIINVDGSFYIEVNCKEESKIIWTDLIGKFDVHFKINKDVPPITSYTITTNVVNGTYEGKKIIYEGSTAKVTITPNMGYLLPEEIEVDGAESNYDSQTGIISLSNPTKDVTITAVCSQEEEVPKYLEIVNSSESTSSCEIEYLNDSSSNGTIYVKEESGDSHELSSDAKNYEYVHPGETIKLYGENSNGFNGHLITLKTGGADISLNGSMMNLIYGEDMTSEEMKVIPEECNFSYFFMMSTSIVSVSENLLPATILSESCYNDLFVQCSNLLNAPKLPAKELKDECYGEMFSGCSKLEEAPVLPAEEMKESCYENMFGGCETLVTPPALPATTLADRCYYEMFCDCYNLVSAPRLPATNLFSKCYGSMFAGCSNLFVNENVGGNEIFTCPSLEKFTSENNPVDRMFEDTRGTFTSTPTEGNTYYTFKEDKYLSIINCGSSDIDVTYVKESNVVGTIYCEDGSELESTTLAPKQTLKLYGENSETGFFGHHIFTSVNSGNDDGNVAIRGTISALIYGTDMTNEEKDVLPANCNFFSFFSGYSNPNATITSVDKNLLPAKTLNEKTNNYGCYQSMFSYCSNLKHTPDLPATILGEACYKNLFSNCTSLISVPKLLADNLKEDCYYNMFWKCSSLEIDEWDGSEISKYKCFFTCPEIGELDSPCAGMFLETKLYSKEKELLVEKGKTFYCDN